MLTNKRLLKIILVFLVSLFLISCETEKHHFSEEWSFDNESHFHKCIDADCSEIEGLASHEFDGAKCKVCGFEKKVREKATVEVSSYEILTDTDYKTTVYKYKSSIEGPKIAIVGGIHGDEVAGWTAALRLKESLSSNSDMRGEVLLIPEANILADKARTRYKVNGKTLSDLNRAFPLYRYDTAVKDSIMIANALLKVVEDFDADYIVDLHESQHSWTTMEGGTSTSLGDTLIAGGNIASIKQFVNRYNTVYRPIDENKFRREESNQKGSFNYYFTNTYPEKIVFTIETNRQRVNGSDTASLDKRVRQQLNVIETLFDFAWERIEN